MVNVRYTEYCSVFISGNKVIFWDEIEDTRIAEIKIQSRETGIEMMNEWVNNAPEGCICEILEYKIGE